MSIIYRGIKLPAGLSHDEINAEVRRIRAEMAASTQKYLDKVPTLPRFEIISDTGWKTSKEGRCYTVQSREVVFAVGATHEQIQHWAGQQNVGFTGQECSFTVMGLVQGGEITVRMRRATDSGD